jgi:RNA polymerase sigma-70 factor (ECF subfamily)
MVPSPSDAAKFERIVLPHLDAAYNLARWLVRHDQDAEDAVQDACVRAHRALDRFQGDDGRAWLLTIVRNVCHTRLHGAARGGEVESFDEEVHGAVNLPAQAEAIAWRELRSEQLRSALERLPVLFREVLVLHDLEGLRYREIALVAEVPIGTVMSRLARARQRLRVELQALARQEDGDGL